MQIHYPHRPTYTNDSLSLTPPAPTILQQRLATPPTSPETYAPPPPSLEIASKRLRSSKSFPLISATNRINTASPKSRNGEEKIPSNDVFVSGPSRNGKPLRRKESRGVLRDDHDISQIDRGSRPGSGSTERGLRKKTSFQRSVGVKQVRLKRAENSTRSLRSEFQNTSGTPPRTTASRPSTIRGGRQEARSSVNRVSRESSDEEVVLDEGGLRESKSCDVAVIENGGTAPIPRSHSDPLSTTAVPVLHADEPRKIRNQGAEDSDEEVKKHDPREVFSKERFLNRHSRDFGHLHAHLATTTTAPDEEIPTTAEEPEDAIEHLVSAAPEVDLDAARREGREKRRSWALYRAGLVSPVPSAVQAWPSTPHSAPAASTSHAVSREPTSSTGRPGHHRRLSSFVTGAHHPALASPASSDTIMATMPPSTIPRQKVMSGGFKPLALVAVAKVGSPASPADNADRSHRRNRWSVGSSGVPPVLERTVQVEEIQEELSIIEERASEKSRGSVVLPRHSDQSHVSLSSLPAPLRTHSSSTMSSSLSSLGAVINNGSPSKSSSSCSSGGEHLGGPTVLSGDAFNFRMSVGRAEQLNPLNNAFGPTQHPTSYATDYPYSGSSRFGAMQTDSNMTLRGNRPISDQIDPEVALASDDKHARAARRRARAFLVAGLKLEEGSLFHDDASVHALDPTKTDTSKRGGLVIDEPPNMEDAATTRESKARKRYSMMRAEKTVPQSSVQQTRLAQDPLPTTSLNPSLMPRDRIQGSAASSATSYHTAVDGRISDSPTSETSSIHRGFMEMLDEHVQSVDDRGRYSISPITSSSVNSGRRSPATGHGHTDPRAMASGITIAVYDPMGHARLPSLSSYQDSVVQERPGATRDNSQGSSGDHHSDEREMDSLELERRLFFNHPLNNASAGKSVRKVKSDFGLSSSQISLPHGRSMSRPTSPVVIHADAAGASPGRPTKTNWSKGVRQWWRDESKANIENETERGFG